MQANLSQRVLLGNFPGYGATPASRDRARPVILKNSSRRPQPIAFPQPGPAVQGT
ncbi:MAG: hypothetical protein SFX18_13265 [Pirellulales bacterium]|nr:hypothetical protein [Pirellulales bacterium]